jgi:hypothetical protein
MVTGPRERGLQCRIATWMHHSITGKRATSPTGTASSHHEPPPATARATTDPTRNVEISHGLGCLQNSPHAAPSDSDWRRRA